VKLASFESLAAAFETAGARYLVAGGLAVGAHGYLQFWSDAHRETSVDVFVTEPVAFNEEYARALVTPLHDKLSIRFVSLPTLIRMKEEAGRPRDRADIEQLRARKDNDADQ
jgi:hypothetical protein